MLTDINELQNLASIILKIDLSIEPSCQRALLSISQQTHILLQSENKKTVMFYVHNQLDKNELNMPSFYYLTLQVIKGSLRTLLWNTFARFDDEYALFYHKLPLGLILYQFCNS